MISEEQIDLLVERLVQRTEQANIYFYKKIGEILKQLKSLRPTEAHQLVQILKYSGTYEEIVKQIAKYTNLNIADIDDIFNAYAKKDQSFYESFYKYRDIPFVPFSENVAIRTQTKALANIIKTEMYDYFRTNVMGFTINGEFKSIKDTYNYLLDEALLNVGQGKETFDSAMSRILKDIGGSGLKTINYASGRSMRLDSAVRMHLKSGLRELHNENQKIYGEEFRADGVELSVHSNPAPDHQDVQGRQFSNEEFDKLQNGEVAKDYKGRVYSLDHDDNDSYRPISELNCYHYVFSIVLGVSKPEYTDSQLKDIINANNEGFMYEGKHYTNYDGTQLQRALERKIREQKDIQILAKASGDDNLVGEAQQKITQLTHKYKELSDSSGLSTKYNRLKVAGYKRVAKSKLK